MFSSSVLPPMVANAASREFLRSSLRFVIPLLGLLVATWFSTVLPALDNARILTLILAVTITAACLRWPTFGVLSVITLTSTIFAYSALPRVGVAGAALYAPEALLLLLIARLALVREALSSTSPVITYFGGAITGLLASAVLSLFLSALRGDSVRDSLTAARYFSLYGVYFVARSILRDSAVYRRLVVGLFMLAVPTAVFFDLLVLTNLKNVLPQNSLLSIDVYNLYVSSVAQPVEQGRVYIPGRALVQFLAPAALFAAVTLPRGRTRLAMRVSTVLFGVTIVLIYTRAVWITTILIVALFAATATRPQQATLGRLFVYVSIVLLPILGGAALSDTSHGSPLDTISERFLTVFTDNVDDPDLHARIVEAQQALEKVKDDLLFGVGFDTPIGTEWSYDPQSGGIVLRNVFVWHNAYLSLLFRIGLFGFAFFGFVVVRIVMDWWRMRSVRATDPFVWSFSVGVGLSLIRILLNGTTESTFDDSFTVPLLALGLALVERGADITLREQPGCSAIKSTRLSHVSPARLVARAAGQST